MTPERIKEIRAHPMPFGPTITELLDEVERLQTPPRCPKCGSDIWIRVFENFSSRQWVITCLYCNLFDKGFLTIDAALNAWRKGDIDNEHNP